MRGHIVESPRRPFPDAKMPGVGGTLRRLVWTSATIVAQHSVCSAITRGHEPLLTPG